MPLNTKKLALLLFCCLSPLLLMAAGASGYSIVEKKLLFLLYALPIWNIIVLLTVNRKRKWKTHALLLSLSANIIGLFMLITGHVTDTTTETRAMGILAFFSAVEFVLLVRWRKA